MSVASHLAIPLDEYDARIRTFIPHYADMLRIAAGLASRTANLRTVVDLGTGTGALAAAVARVAPQVAIVGVDEDEEMLAAAGRRLRRHHPRFIHGSFARATLPRCELITASLALHHIDSPRSKRALFVRARRALRSGGWLVSADCYPSSVPSLAADGRRVWRDHLAATYGVRKAESFLKTWAKEDFYKPLDVELSLLQTAGFAVDVVWRRGSFAVIAAQSRG